MSPAPRQCARRCAGLLAAVLALGACAALPANHRPDPADPFERFNRSVFKFNRGVDHAVLRPLARGYQAITPKPVRQGVSNFVTNFSYPVTIVNEFLQGAVGAGGRDTVRLVLNTTVGLGGLLDVASHVGLPQHASDFGLTLGTWGARPGAYLMLPFLGPSTVRDGFGKLPDMLFQPRSYLANKTVRYGEYALEALDLRTQLLSTDALLDRAFDPYAFTRNAWLQRREYLLHGEPPAGSDEELPPEDPGSGAEAP